MLAARFFQHLAVSTGTLLAAIPCPFPELSSPGARLPLGAIPHIIQQFWLPGLSFCSTLYSLGPGYLSWQVALFSSPVCPLPHMVQCILAMFTLDSPRCLISHYALHCIYNKLSPLPQEQSRLFFISFFHSINLLRPRTYLKRNYKPDLPKTQT